MNIESILKEREDLQKQQHHHHHADSPLLSVTAERKIGGGTKQLTSAPSISEDFKRWHLQSSLSMDEQHAAAQEKDSSNGRDSTPPSSTSGGFLLQEAFSSTKTQQKPTATKNAVVQQTSVIMSVRQSSTEKPLRLKSFQRQKSITEDDAMEFAAASPSPRKQSSDNNNNNNNNNNSSSESISTSSHVHANRKTLPHSIACFLDDSSSYHPNPLRQLATSKTNDSSSYHHNPLRQLATSKTHYSKTIHEPTSKPHSLDRSVYTTKIQHQQQQQQLSVNKLKSKSLDNEAAGAVAIDYSNRPSSGARLIGYPMRYHHHQQSPAKHSSFESEDQGARFINALHITPPPAPRLYGGDSSASYPDSPCGGGGESPKEAMLLGNRHSPATNGISPIAKRVLLSDTVAGSPIGAHDRRSPRGTTSEHSAELFTGRSRGNEHFEHAPFTKSRSQDLQLQRHYKYTTQKKAYTLATAPYDVYEKSLRRILSEENVPENLLVNKSLSKHFYTASGMRRAASYDLISRSSSSNSPTNSSFRQSSDPANYLRHHVVAAAANHTTSNVANNNNAGKSTKIMFPEHDNVTDCDSIFTQPIVDERAHAQRINKIMSDFTTNNTSSANSNSPNTNHPYQYQHHHGNHNMAVHPLQQSLSSSYDDVMEKVMSSASSSPSSNNVNNNRGGGGDGSTKQGGGGTPKSLTNQSSMDKNLTIGPYQYHADVDDEVAVNVSGLLTLPGSNEKKYPITVGELRRRIAPPEFLNKVDMISYVRLAKTSARELLEKHVIRPKHHSRKSKHSVISKMCEAECAELANGVKMLSDLYFPKEWLANHVVTSLGGSEGVEEGAEMMRRQRLADAQRRIEITKSVLKDLSELVTSKKDEGEMQNYKLATHSFGTLNLNNNIELLTSILQTQSDVITGHLCCDDDVSMETESGIGSKNSSMDDPHM